MDEVFLLAFFAALNPTLLAATTLMLVLPSPKRLLLGYLCGAMMTSITIGCVFVFTVGSDGSNSTTSTSQHQLSPAFDITIGALLVIVAFVASSERDRFRERRERKRAAKADKKPPKWKQALSGGSARTTFVVGALLTLPGASYLAALTKIAHQDLSTTERVLTIVAFNLIMLLLLELPLIGYAVAPDWTETAVGRFTAWIDRSGGRVLIVGGFILGTLLIVRGVAGLIV